MDDKLHNDPIGQLLKETATERAPEGFARGVMDRIQAVEAARAPVPPLIPRWAWALIAAATAALAGWGWLAGGGRGESLLPESFLQGSWEPIALPAWEAPTMPPSLIYGVAALALFVLLQVVLMRRRLERQWTEALH